MITNNTESDSNWGSGTQVAKVFNYVFYEGEVTGQHEVEDKKGKKFQCWRIKYSDGDEEDLNVDEMKSARKLYLSVLQRNIV